MNQQTLSTERAQHIVAAAIKASLLKNTSVAVSVVDTGGHLCSFARMDGVAYLSIDITKRKALTALNFKMPNHELLALSSAMPAFAMELPKHAELCFLPGGIPIFDGAVCIGAIGVGGATPEMDMAIAREALEG